MRIDNELIPFQVESSPDRQFYRNAGSARHRGVDADVTAEIASAVRLHGSYSFTNARYTTYAVQDGEDVISYATNRVPGVAPNLASLSLQLGSPAHRFVSIDERYRSAIPVNDANTVYSPASIVTNVRGVYPLSRVSVFAGVDNVFGEIYNTSVSINAFGGRYFDPAAGRSIYAGVDLFPLGRGR
jgi:iron complex outermembrane receptor protein